MLKIVFLTIVLEVSEYLVELMNDKNKGVAKMSSKALDILAVSCRQNSFIKKTFYRSVIHNWP